MKHYLSQDAAWTWWKWCHLRRFEEIFSKKSIFWGDLRRFEEIFCIWGDLRRFEVAWQPCQSLFKQNRSGTTQWNRVHRSLNKLWTPNQKTNRSENSLLKNFYFDNLKILTFIKVQPLISSRSRAICMNEFTLVWLYFMTCH